MSTGAKDKIRIIKDYMRFRLDARSRFTIHSPFLFELVNDVLRDKRKFYAFEEIEGIRNKMLNNPEVIAGNFPGAASKTLSSDKRRINDIAKTSALPPKYCRLLFKLVNHFKPKKILELGTGTGISTLYMAAAARTAKIISLEGSEEVAAMAEKNIAYSKDSNIQIRQGLFEDTLDAALHDMQQINFAFVDGDHRRQQLLRNVRKILAHSSPDAVIVIDDIYWSEEMTKAWNEISILPDITLSIDLFRLGILFTRKGIVKQHLKVVW